VAKVETSIADGTISQQAAVHPWLAAEAHGNKQNSLYLLDFNETVIFLKIFKYQI
jgi:hypothetical protein